MRVAQVHDPHSPRYKHRVTVELRLGSYAVKRLITETLPVDDVAHLLRCTKASVNNEEITAFCKLMNELRNDPEAVDLAREYFAECDESRPTLCTNPWENHFYNPWGGCANN